MRYLQYLRTPYKHQGRDFSGADCFGLLQLFYRHELGIELPDFNEDYSDSWFLDHDYFRDLYQEYGFEPTTEKAFSNLIFFRNTTTRIGHVGIILDSSHFIHMTTSGCGIDSYIFGGWQRQLDSVYRYKPETA